MCVGGGYVVTSWGLSQAVLWTPTAANATALCSVCPGFSGLGTNPIAYFIRSHQKSGWGCLRDGGIVMEVYSSE